MEKKIFLIIRKILIVLLILWMIGVFFLSNQNGDDSGNLSKKVSLYICFGNEEAANNIEPTIRKVAHMTEYAIGAMLFYGILVTYQKFSIRMKVGMTFAFLLVFAGLDEFHQSFIDERSGNLVDIGIDVFGGALGVGASYLMEGMIKAVDSKVQSEIEENI